MVRKIIFTEGEYYHIYNRGTDKRNIFLENNDYDRFIRLLYLCNGTMPITTRTIATRDTYTFERGEEIVDIGAYCLMPNHFHILIREKTAGGITKFMSKLCTAFSMYFNLKYERTGALFQGAFKAEHADSDRYLKYLFAYIHLNPIKIIDASWKEKGIRDLLIAENYLSHYSYSSYLDYKAISRRETGILNRKAFPEYFSNIAEFDSFTRDWLSYADFHTQRAPEGNPR